MKRMLAGLLGTVAAGALCADAVRAQTLTVGVLTETTSMSPLYFNWNPNNQIFMHVYSHLVARGHKHELLPGLAVSWKPIDDKTWEFKLRQGVKWHDGSPFTADDVLFTVEEAKNVAGTASPGGRYFFGKEYKKIDDHTFHVTTGGPYPLMPNDLGVCSIISKKNGTGKSTEDYNAGRGVVGTGPYRFVEWAKGDRVVLEAWKDYWGGGPNDFIPKPSWERIVYKPIVSDPSRVAALLNGDVDMIDYVPTPDVTRLKANSRVTIAETPSDRVIYLQVDTTRDISPDVLANDGKPAWPNPLRDWRVRKAISKAINREAIVARTMEGVAMVAGQMPVPGMFGYSPNIKPEAYDPDGAKKLLAEAGWPDGFRISVRGPNDRYVNDGQVIETIAGQLARIGIKADVKPEPKATYFNRAHNYSLMLMGFGSDTGEASSILTSVIHSRNPARNFGFSNESYHINRRVDAAIEAGLVELNDAKRERHFQEAMEIVVADLGVIPLHYQVNVWALKKGLKYPARHDERTLGIFVAKE